MKYGGDRTIHASGEVNVELDRKGKVVSVWYRCMMLPFTQDVVDDNRAADMEQAYAERDYNNRARINEIDIEIPE